MDNEKEGAEKEKAGTEGAKDEQGKNEQDGQEDKEKPVKTGWKTLKSAATTATTATGATAATGTTAVAISETSVGSNSYDDDEDTEDEHEEDVLEERRRKSSFGFDEYQFDNPILDDNDDPIIKADENAQSEAERFFQMARLKTDDYSKIDIVKMASTMGGLLLDEHMVEPVHISEDVEERSEAARAIYGQDMRAESEPFKDPVTALEAEEEEANVAERIRSPPNLYEALQSNFLKSNYKTSMYRLFLIGTHDENLTYFIDWNKDLVDLINVQSYTEPLNGVLCVYEYYFIHVLEGSEDNLIKLMQRYANDLEPSGYEWDLKFHYKSGRYTARDHARFHTVSTYVLGIFRIQERQLIAWRGEKVFPNKMHLNDVPAGGFRERYFHFLRQCMVMAFTYNRMAPTGFNPVPEHNEELSAQVKKTFERAKIQRFKSLGKVVTPITFIQYILDHKDNSKLKIRPIREHLELFGGTPPYISSSNTEWPPPGRIASYD